MNRWISFRLVSSFALALVFAACAPDDGATEADNDETLQKNEEPADESTEDEASDDEDDVAQAATQPAPPCNTFTADYRDEATARAVANDWPGRLLCVRSIDEAGVANAWSVSYGESCTCSEPRVLTLP